MATEKEPQNKNIGESQQQQIELPNGRIAIVQGQKNSRILISLNNDSIKDGSGVDSEVLIAPDIASGMSRFEALDSLHNSIRGLKIITLMGTDYTIFHTRRRNGKRDAPGSYRLAIASEVKNNTSMITVILTDDTTTVSLPPRQAKMLQQIIASGKKGVNRVELQKSYSDAEKELKTLGGKVYHDIALIKAVLRPTPFKVKNLTPTRDRAKGIGARYVYMEKSQEELALLSKSSSPVTDLKQNDAPVLAEESGETTIFVANGDVDSMEQSPSEDPQDEGEEESEDEYIPPTAEEARQNELKRQAQLQVALNLFNALNNRKLDTLDKDPFQYIQGFIPECTTEQDAKTFLLSSIDGGLKYWDNNEWEFPDDLKRKQLAETCLDLRDIRRRPRYTPEIARKEIIKHFNLPQD